MAEPGKRGRGRPKSAATLEREAREAQNAWLKNPPIHILSASGLQEMKAWIATSARAEKDILSTYKYDAFYPDSQAYAMESLGDEMVSGYEDQILGKEAELREKITARRRKGAQTQAEQAERKATALVTRNADLVEKYRGDPRRFSLNRIAIQIYDEWESSTPARGRVLHRGITVERPSKATIRRWIKRAKIV